MSAAADLIADRHGGRGFYLGPNFAVSLPLREFIGDIGFHAEYFIVPFYRYYFPLQGNDISGWHVFGVRLEFAPFITG